MSSFQLDKFKEECGIFGVFDHAEASTLTQLGLFALQHRGQEACGIVSSDSENLHQFRSQGLVADVLSEDVLKKLTGSSAIGHAPQIDITAAAAPPIVRPISPPVRQSVIASMRN